MQEMLPHLNMALVVYIHFDLDKHFIEKLLHGWGVAYEDDGSSWGANTTSVISDRALGGEATN